MAVLISLNLGCNNDRFGDVRVDIGREYRPTVICDAHHLPFKDDAFMFVKMRHVLEHLKWPATALAEARRVGFVVNASFPTHKNRIPWLLWTLTTFDIRMISFGIFRAGWWILRDELTDGPMKHRWMVLPGGQWRINKVPIPSCKLFSRIAFNMDMEYECVWSRPLWDNVQQASA